MKDHQLISNILKTKDYFGFKFDKIRELSDYVAYEFRFIKNNDYFNLLFSYEYFLKTNPEEILNKIETMIYNMPEFKEQVRKIKHHKEFYNKFDKILNE